MDNADLKKNEKAPHDHGELHCGRHHHEHSHEEHDCSHHHEHSHEEHDCQHHHEHSDYEHTNLASHEHEGITISYHEGASVYSAEREFALKYEEAKSYVADKLEELSEWVQQNDGIVGHIKAFLTEQSRMAMLSSTGGATMEKEMCTPKVKISINAIVFIKKEGTCCKISEIFKHLSEISDKKTSV